MYNGLRLVMLFCLAAGFLSLPGAFGQGNPSGDQIVENYLQAMGGRKALAAIQDQTMKGTFSVSGMSGTILIQKKSPNKTHQLFDLGTAKAETWFDGTQGYRINPMRGDGPFTAEEVAEAKATNVISPFLNSQERGVKLKYVKKDKVGDSEADVVDATDSGGKVTTYFFDTFTHYLIQVVAPVPAGEGEGTLEIKMSDYRDVKGLKFPFKTVRSTPAMTIEMVIDSVEVNVGIADTAFQHSAN